jgi:hypothetical protein
MERSKRVTPTAEPTTGERRGRRGLGRVRFLAHLDRIRASVTMGYPLRLIYEEHREELDTSYCQFARYVKKFIRPPDSPSSRKTPGTPLPQESGRKPDGSAATQIPKAPNVEGQPGFRYQPAAGDDDLV